MADPGGKRTSSPSKAKLPCRLHRAPVMHAVGQSSTDRCDKSERRTISADATEAPRRPCSPDGGDQGLCLLPPLASIGSTPPVRKPINLLGFFSIFLNGLLWLNLLGFGRSGRASGPSPGRSPWHTTIRPRP